jgi:hypothetical protein
MSSPSTIQCFDNYAVSCAFVYLDPMPRPFQHHIDAPSIPLHQSGAPPSHMGQLSRLHNPDPDLSAGPETYLVYCADEIYRTSSCKRSRFLTQRDSLCVFSLFFSFATKPFRIEELSREKEKDTSCQLVSTFQHPRHAATQRSNPGHTVITSS